MDTRRFLRPGGSGGLAASSATQDPAVGRAAEALRHAGGVLPIERLCAEVAPAAGGVEPAARCVRQRSDLFLLIERPALPWAEDWTPAEQVDYARGQPRRDASVVLLDGSVSWQGPPPAVLRETLLSMWTESPEDEELRRELGRAV